jgi:hypothetical protein
VKSFKQYIAEMDLSKEPPDYENVEDRRGNPAKIKAGDKKVKSSAGGGGTYTQAEADEINRENDFRYPKVNKKYGEGGIPMPKFPETNKKTVSVEPPKLPKPEPAPKTNQKPAVVPDEPYDQAKVDKRREAILKKTDEIVASKTKELTTPDSASSRVDSIDTPLRTPLGQRGSTSSPSTPSIAPGMANPEWIKKHSWINDAIKQDRVKRDKIAASTTIGGPRGPNGPSSPPSNN